MWFTRNINESPQQFYLKTFPKHLTKEVLLVLPHLKNSITNYHSQTYYHVKIQQEFIQIPVRVYFDVPNLEFSSGYSHIQKQILWCIYSRHHDGFVRQKAIRQLLKYDLQDFIIPYIFQLLGEYVSEILEDIEPFIHDNNKQIFAEFISKNPQYFQYTESRIISYWNEYYRLKYPDFKDYVGYRILFKLKNFVQKNSHDSNKMH